jgi:ATP-binding cassette subfamily F protein 3
MVSHDIEFVRGVATTIWELKPEGVTKYFGDYDYYLEKSGALKLNSAPAADALSPDGQSVSVAKDRRRARAQARNAISGELRKVKKLVEDLEKRLDEQAVRKSVLVAKLSSGEKVDFSALNKELAVLDKEISATESEWENAATELEALRLENDRIHQE